MSPSGVRSNFMVLPDWREVLVFRALQLGDMLCAVPALRALREGLPNARIVLVGLPWAAQFAQRFSALVDEFIAFPGHPSLPEASSDPKGWPSFRRRMRARRADLAIQLHGSGQLSNPIVKAFGARCTVGFTQNPLADGAGFFPYPQHGHESERLLVLPAALGLPTSDRGLAFPLKAADDSELTASAVPASLDGRPYACLHAGARSRERRWPVEAFAGVADHLAASFGLQIVLTGSADEHVLAQQLASMMRHPAVNAALPLSVSAMAALMDGARLLVCNDTGVSHLAVALRLPSVVIFRHAWPARWAPQDRQLHRCVFDSTGADINGVIAEVRHLMATPVVHQRCRSARD